MEERIIVTIVLQTLVTIVCAVLDMALFVLWMRQPRCNAFLTEDITSNVLVGAAIIIFVDPGVFYMNVNDNINVKGRPGQIILEYTKTTD